MGPELAYLMNEIAQAIVNINQFFTRIPTPVGKNAKFLSAVMPFEQFISILGIRYIDFSQTLDHYSYETSLV